MYDIRGNNGPFKERSNVSEQFQKEGDKRSYSASWIAIGVLAAATAGLCWYGYPTLRQAPSMLAQVPGFEKSFESLNRGLAEMDVRIKAWGRSQHELQNQVAKLDQETASRFRAARKQMQGLKAEVHQSVQEVATASQAIDNKLVQLESTSAYDRASLEKLESEIATLREETIRQAEELRDARGEIERENETRDKLLASLNEVGRATRDAENMARKLTMKRIDFEVSCDRSQELTEGLSLHVTGTDVSHRRVTGWVWVMPDRRAIWLRAQAAQQPVVFYGYPDGGRRELVLTNVTKNSVTGYLLLPIDADSKLTASLVKGD